MVGSAELSWGGLEAETLSAGGSDFSSTPSLATRTYMFSSDDEELAIKFRDILLSIKILRNTVVSENNIRHHIVWADSTITV